MNITNAVILTLFPKGPGEMMLGHTIRTANGVVLNVVGHEQIMEGLFGDFGNDSCGRIWSEHKDHAAANQDDNDSTGISYPGDDYFFEEAAPAFDKYV